MSCMGLSERLLPDRIIIILMLAGFVLGASLFFILSPRFQSYDVRLDGLGFYLDDSTINLNLTNADTVALRCELEVRLYSGDENIFMGSAESGLIPPGETRTLGIEAEVSQREFDYDISVDCRPRWMVGGIGRG